MSFNLIPFGFSCIVNAILAVLLGSFVIFSPTPNKLLAHLWGIASLFIALWSFGLGMMVSETNHEWAIFWMHLHYLGCIFIPASFFHFVSVLTRHEFWHKRAVLFAYVISTLLLLLNLGGYLVAGVEPRGEFRHYTVFGKYYFLFVLHLLGFVGYSHYVMLNAIPKALGSRKVQIKCMLFSALIGFLGGLSTLFPVFNIFRFHYLNYFMGVYVFIMTYAVLRHHLMDIEVIIKRTLVFAGIVATVVGTTSFLFSIVQAFVGQAVGISLHAMLFVAVATTVLVYRPLERLLINVTDRFLFQKKFDYRELLRNASQGIALIQSLDRLARLIVTFVTIRARVKNVAVFISSKDGAGFSLQAQRGAHYPEELSYFPVSHPLIRRLVDTKLPIRLADLALAGKERDRDTETIQRTLKELKAEAVIPSFLGRNDQAAEAQGRMSLRSVLVLGQKKSDEEYTKEDLDVFYTLAQEAAIAIENARLYDAQIQKTEELARANKELATVNQQLNDASSKLIRALSETEKAKKELESTQAQMLDMKRRELIARISAAMGHEIKNPLQGVSFTYYHFTKLNKILDETEAYARQMGDEKLIELTEKISKTINQDIALPLRSHIDRIKGIANSVTDLIKGQDRFSDIHLGLIINYAIEEIRFTTYWERLAEPTIEINIPRNLPLANANAHRIQGVFVNLIKNAYDAMQDSTERRITVTAEEDPDRPDFIRVIFADTGCGMDEEILKHAFEFKFTTKGEKGTGIGLAYCKDTIEMHGGAITAISEVGKGTKFIFSLRKGTPYGEGGDIYEKDVGHRG